jgi:tetratricopeptide (TPR) repeat protein
MRLAAALALLALTALPASADRAAAEKALAEGDALMARQDFDGAIPAYGRAIEADRGFAAGWGGRSYAKMKVGLFTSALEDVAIAIELEPGEPRWILRRHSLYLGLDRWAEAAEEAEDFLAKNPSKLEWIVLLGMDLVNVGRVDEGLARLKEGAEKTGVNLTYEAHLAKADWAEAERACTASLARGSLPLGLGRHLGVALVEQGKFDEARRVLEALKPKVRSVGEIAMAEAYLLGTPAAAEKYDPDASLRTLDQLAAQTVAHVLNTRARTLFYADRLHEALDVLTTRGHRTNFETLFWAGACQWKLGRLDEARLTLAEAWRLNPYLAANAQRVEGLGDFVASVERDLKAEAGPGADPRKLARERGTHPLTIAEIEALVRRYRFRRAVEEYETLLPELASGARKAEVEARLPEVRAMAAALAKIVGEVNTGKLKAKVKLSGLDLTVVKADDLFFSFTVPKGEGKFPWAFLEPGKLGALAVDADLGPEEQFGLGCLLWESGDLLSPIKCFETAAKKQPALKTRITAFIARRRGIDPPGGGFVLLRDAYVTPEEKENLGKGLVRFRDRWVTPQEKENLAKGMIQVAGMWVPGDEKELLRRGFVKHEGKWMAREDYEALRKDWAAAWAEETAHYTVKTNHSEALAKELAGLAEAAYGEFKRYWGAEPKLTAGEKMTLYAFRTYEDYRKYCVDNNAEGQLGGAGFATSASNVVVGWNKTSNLQQFLQTMVHEAAHLYYFRVAHRARAPSWHAEGLATYFEGFSWDGKSWRFHHVSDSRLAFAQRAMKEGSHIPLDEMFKADALALINSDTHKALLFYAQCWALNLYLSETDDRAYREAFAAFRKSVEEGGQEPLSKFIPDLGKLEKDWVRFVSGL